MMTIDIKARVVDIKRDTPTDQDRFFIDTNICYWLAYNRAMNIVNYQVTDYPHYVSHAAFRGSKFYKSALSFAELVHIIESNELDIFKRSRPDFALVTRKEFRTSFKTEYAATISEIESAWKIVDELTGYNTLETNIDNKMIEKSLDRLKHNALDGYDIFMLEIMLASGLTQIITDDSDYAKVEGITVFTSNRNVILEATKKSLLLKR